MEAATGQMNNRLNSARSAIALETLFDLNHRLKHSDITSSAATRLNNSITIFFRIGADAVLIPFDGALLPHWSLWMRISLIWDWIFARARSKKRDHLPRLSIP